MANVTNINLLPWREQRRTERNRKFLTGCIFAWLIAGVLAFLMINYWDGRIDHQNARNAYLQSEIAKLQEVIKEIDTLKDKRAAIIDRMEVIQTLQTNRAQIVHMFDDLVKKLPSGLFLDDLNKEGKRLSMTGNAQSNGRVSALMRNLDSSDWFANASLDVVDLVDENGGAISKFNLKVAEESKSEDDDISASEVQ